jgi:hypothetical protein
MNASEQREIAEFLDQALRNYGIKVERVRVVNGNVKAWDVVPAEAIIGRWLQNGWRVTGNNP